MRIVVLPNIYSQGQAWSTGSAELEKYTNAHKTQYMKIHKIQQKYTFLRFEKNYHLIK